MEKSSAKNKIRFRIGKTTVTATLGDNEASRDFVSLLPLDIELNDYFRREKSGQIPRTLSEEGPRRYTCDVADVVYWPPGPHLAVFYRHDARPLPEPGAVLLGTIDSGVEAFADSAPVHAVIERIANDGGSGHERGPRHVR